MIVRIAISSAGVAIGISAALEPLRRKGAQRQRAAERLRQLRVEDERLAAREQREHVPPRQLLRAREEARAASSTRSSLTYTEGATSSTPRSSGIRITAASTPSSSTIDDASTSSVVSSERLWANVREISCCACNRPDFSCSDASACFRSS